MQPEELKTPSPLATSSATHFQKLMLHKRIHSQVLHQTLIMSGQIFKMGPLFQRIILNKQGEYVMLNNLDVTFRRLKRSCIIYLGASTNITNQNEIVYVDSVDELKKYFQQLDTNYDKDVTFHIIYQKNKQEQYELLNFLHSQNNIKIKFYFVKPKSDENIFYFQQIQIKIAQIKSQQQTYQFPSYSEISVDGNNKKINLQRQTLYTFFAGLDFQQARRDLVKFYEYILDNSIFLWKQEDLKSIIAHYKSHNNPQYRNSKKILRYYTYAQCCYKLINMCLRSLIDPRDLAYIRLLFLDLFLSVAELFTKQQSLRKEFKLSNAKLYRGCYLSLKQIDQLATLKGKYIQMNGFLSTSKSKKQAKRFFQRYNDQIKVLFVIDLPQILKSTDIFHSFAFIGSEYSLFNEKQVLFNPLNAFQVLHVKQINKNYYQIHLKYADIARLCNQYKGRQKLRINQITPEQKTQEQKIKDDIESKILTNFEYHKLMFTLNRTQGEVFWRNIKKQFSHPFYSGLIRKMLNKEKKIMQKHSQYQNHKFKFIKVSTLYKQLRKFIPDIPDFEWFSSYNKNIQLVTRFVINNKNKALQIFFYTSKIFASLYCYERSIIYSVTCFQIILEIYQNISASPIVWLVGDDIGLMLFNLGKINQALSVFDWSSQLLKRATNSINLTNFQFLLFPMYILFIRGENEKFNKFRQLSINKLAVLKQSRINVLWKSLLLDLTDMKAIIQFLKFYRQTTQFPSRSFIKIIIFVIEYLEKQFDSNSADLSNEKIAIMKQDLEIAVNCLVNFQNLYECYKPLSKIFVIYFSQDQQKYDFAQIQKTVASSKFNKMFCYELQIYLTTLKYVFKTCKKLQTKPIKQYTRLMINLAQYLHEIMNHYLIDIYYTVMSLFCEATLLSKYKNNKNDDNKLLQNEKLKNKRNCLAVKSFWKILAYYL